MKVRMLTAIAGVRTLPSGAELLWAATEGEEIEMEDGEARKRIAKGEAVPVPKKIEAAVGRRTERAARTEAPPRRA